MLSQGFIGTIINVVEVLNIFVNIFWRSHVPFWELFAVNPGSELPTHGRADGVGFGGHRLT